MERKHSASAVPAYVWSVEAPITTDHSTAYSGLRLMVRSFSLLMKINFMDPT
jgi:hypothetical protein